MKRAGFEFILFDMIGTTVMDNGAGDSCIMDCFVTSFHQCGIPVNREKFIPLRGRSKLEAIQELLPDSLGNSDLPERIYSVFLKLLKDSLDRFSEMPGASELFRFLKEYPLKIGLGSGLPGGFMTDLIRHLEWDFRYFDYLGSSEEIGHGRPHPAMILDSMKKLNILDPSRVLKIGDTAVDILEGKNAGVRTAVVLTGTQALQDLILHGPDFIFQDITMLKNIL